MSEDSKTQGKVFLVGAGPGAPGLLTLRGRELIESCDVLVYDYLVHESLINLRRPDCEAIYVGKRPRLHTIPQEDIEAILVQRARHGKHVVRLKGGDPLVFGRGGEEARRLREQGIPFEIVPGVTAAVAAAGYAGFPLTDRRVSSAVLFLTGHEDTERQQMRVDFREYARSGGTLCVYMGMGNLGRLVAQLREGGMPEDMPAAVVQWASLGRQRVAEGTLSTIQHRVAEAGLGPPAIVVFGQVVRMREHLKWFEERPLAGYRVVVTRSQEQAGNLARLLDDAGAEVLELPLIEVRRDIDAAHASEILGGMATYEWLVFTSANGVRHFFDAFFEKFQDLRCLGPMRIACIGPATAREVERLHLQVDVIPKKHNAEALGKAITGFENIEHRQILVITGNRNREALVKLLHEEGGAIVDTFQVYRTDLADLSRSEAARLFREEGADAITFTSSSTARSFARQARALMPEADARVPKGVSMGPKTSEAMREAGIPVDAQAKQSTLPELVQAVKTLLLGQPH